MRKPRYEEVFQAWLKQRSRYDDQTFTYFKNRCDAGEVEGFSIYEEPVSDTAAGDAEGSVCPRPRRP